MEFELDEIKEQAGIRKALKPMVENMTEQLAKAIVDKGLSEVHVHVPKPDVEVAVNDIHVENFPKVQKVEVVNQPVEKKLQKIVGDVVAKIANFPAIQKITGKVDVDFPKVQKVEGSVKVDFPKVQQVSGLVQVEDVRVDNLPIGVQKDVDIKKANPSNYLVVRVTDGREFLDGTRGGAGAVVSQPAGEKLWLREEYSYTTVSGMQVVDQVVKFDDKFKLTIEYEYDDNANVTNMYRKVERNDEV